MWFFTFGQVKVNACGDTNQATTKVFEFVKFNLATPEVAIAVCNKKKITYIALFCSACINILHNRIVALK